MNRYWTRSTLSILLVLLASVGRTEPPQTESQDQPSVTESPGQQDDLAASSARQLSVAPSSELVHSDDLPDWVESSPWLEDSPHRWPVQSTPASTPQLSRHLLQAQTRAAAETYVETLLDDPAASLVIDLTDGWIDARVDPDRRYEGEVRVGSERLYVAAAELRFDVADQQWIKNRWRSHLVARRLGGLVIAVGGGVGLLWLVTVALSIVVGRRERRLS